MDSDTLHSMHQLVKDHLIPRTYQVNPNNVLVTPEGYTVHDLNELVKAQPANPLRPKGTSTHDTLDSLIAHAKRHGSPDDTVAFCALTGDRPRLVAVYNYHPVEFEHGGWQDHKGVYEFPVSDAWARWTRAANGEGLSVGEFAELLEEGIGDVRDPAGAGEVPQLPGVRYATPAELLTLANGLSVRVEQKVVDQRRLDNGTVAMTFAEEHTNDKGEPLRIPTGFLLGVPAFVGGDLYALPVRLRYRVKNGAVVWTLALHDAAGVRRDAITAAAERFRTETGLPLFFGTPDA